jgi:hypothetical protein
MSSLCRHVHGRHEQSRNKQSGGPMRLSGTRACAAAEVRCRGRLASVGRIGGTALRQDRVSPRANALTLNKCYHLDVRCLPAVASDRANAITHHRAPVERYFTATRRRQQDRPDQGARFGAGECGEPRIPAPIVRPERSTRAALNSTQTCMRTYVPRDLTLYDPYGSRHITVVRCVE